MNIRRLILFSFELLLLPLLHAQSGKFFPPTTTGDGIRYPLVLSPAIWHVQGPVAAVPGSDGVVHLAYALRITNTVAGPMKIESLQIVNPFAGYEEVGKNRVLAVDNQDITAKVNLVPAPPALDGSGYTDVLNAGASGIMFLDVTFANIEAVPAFISHRLTVSQSGADGKQHTSVPTDPPVAVDRRDPIVLSPPLRGPRWLDGDSCCAYIGGHRWAMTPINGRAEAVETFGADLVQLRKDGRVFAGPVDQLSSYEYYGAPVYCAGPGTVVEVVRDLPDEKPGRSPTNSTVESAAGNHVIIAMGSKHYAMYAHFAPFSVTVQVGDVVQEGQILGKLGNSGNTSTPHLHFQVMDQPSSLGARGLPFVFDHMRRRFRYAGSLDDEGRQTISGEPLSLMAVSGCPELHNKMPLTFDLLDFDGN